MPPRTVHHGPSGQEPLQYVAGVAQPGLSAYTSIAHALLTSSIVLGGVATVLATLVSAKAHASGAVTHDHSRTSLIRYGRASFRLAAILNLIALLLVSKDGGSKNNIMTAAKLVVKLAASSVLALFTMDRLR